MKRLATAALIAGAVLTTVRCQGFWNSWPRDLAERLAHLFVDLRRLDCGIANAAV